MTNPAPDPNDPLFDPWLRGAPVIEGFKVLDPVVLYTRIGKGGMGAVYRGRHFKLDLDVAVKCLKPSLADEDPAYVQRFEREARLAASLAHQNVVRVMDVQQQNGLHYLVMEFVRGETAQERVTRKGALAEAEALAIVLGACTGLAEAHARGIVHRDIKPDNVMISVEGRVKLADLGLARATQSTDGRSVGTALSAIMGTPQYMPPEQWRSPDVGPAADVWALGATLWFLLAGEHAIANGPHLDVAGRILEQDFPSLRARRPDVRRKVHQLIERCVRRAPGERFADARELLAALRGLSDGDEARLADPAAVVRHEREGIVTPPPRDTLLRIRAELETEAANLRARAQTEPVAGGPRPAATAATRPAAPTAATMPSPPTAAPTVRPAAAADDGGPTARPRHPAPEPAPAAPRPRAAAAAAPAVAEPPRRRRRWLAWCVGLLLLAGLAWLAYALFVDPRVHPVDGPLYRPIDEFHDGPQPRENR